MRIIALGAGSIGRYAISTAGSRDGVESIVVADRDEAAATAAAEQLEGVEARALALDLEDHDAVVAAMREADVVINTVGPFFRLGEPAVRAAIEAGRPYVDINDDFEPTRKILALDEEAKAAGVPIVIGMGSSPGITNVLAKKACAELDSVEHVQTAWGVTGGRLRRRPPRWGSAAEVEPPADKVHWMMSCSGAVPVWREGRETTVSPIRNTEYVYFPNGVAVFNVVGHPEPLTIPRFIPGVRSCSNVAGRTPEEITALLEVGARIEAGELDHYAAAQEFLYRRDLLSSRRPAETVDLGPELGAGVYASARGERDGAGVLIGYGTSQCPPGRGMEPWTGAPLALVAEMLGRGELASPGVLAPEACVPPDLFLERYAALCPGAPAVDELLFRVEVGLD